MYRIVAKPRDAGGKIQRMAKYEQPNIRIPGIVGSAAAASDGSITITATFTAAGAWKVTSHGQTSNKDVTTQLTVQ